VRGSDTIRLGQLFGIRVGVSRWWFLVLFFVIYALNGYFGQILPNSTQAFIVAVLGALLFFATVVGHELGHALVARHQGMTIEGVDLWALGGFTRTRGETLSAGAEFRMAAAGPAVNALVIALAVLLGLAFGSFHHFLDVALLQSGLRVSAPLVLLAWLALINFVLLVFNLLPAFPLDGGRIARALVWRITGDPNRATRACARLGRLLGIVVIAGGVGLVLESYTTGGLWFVLIGLFLTQSARQALAQATVGALIRDVTVADIMDRRPVTVPSQTTLLDVDAHYFRDGDAPWLVVADDDGHYRGLLLKERLEQELQGGRPALTAAEVSIDSPPLRIDASATLEVALRSDALRRLGAIVAVDADGKLAGVLTLPSIRRAMNPSAAL
jgi:Zn-dependent protease